MKLKKGDELKKKYDNITTTYEMRISSLHTLFNRKAQPSSSNSIQFLKRYLVTAKNVLFSRLSSPTWDFNPRPPITGDEILTTWLRLLLQSHTDKALLSSILLESRIHLIFST